MTFIFSNAKDVGTTFCTTMNEKWGENARQTCLVALRIMKLAELSNANLFEAVLWFTLFHISFVYNDNILVCHKIF